VYQLEPIKTKKSNKTSFLFYDYAPKVFHLIRNFYGYNTETYLQSIGPENLFGSLAMGHINSLENQMSEGKSGSMFYYTADGLLMLKTISHNEFVHFKNTMKDYYEHMLSYPHTLITRFFGLHKVKFVYKGAIRDKRIYFIIMANVFNTPRHIDIRYDLKGSMYGRITKKKEGQVIPSTVALKDQDWLNDDQVVNIKPA
jgi:1-phosphatidylinositol-4-phosphate 5-kinase